jgi:hypothetical protein
VCAVGRLTEPGQLGPLEAPVLLPRALDLVGSSPETVALLARDAGLPANEIERVLRAALAGKMSSHLAISVRKCQMLARTHERHGGNRLEATPESDSASRARFASAIRFRFVRSTFPVAVRGISSRTIISSGAL